MKPHSTDCRCTAGLRMTGKRIEVSLALRAKLDLDGLLGLTTLDDNRRLVAGMQSTEALFEILNRLDVGALKLEHDVALLTLQLDVT